MLTLGFCHPLKTLHHSVESVTVNVHTPRHSVQLASLTEGMAHD